jgi:hypothetical protein
MNEQIQEAKDAQTPESFLQLWPDAFELSNAALWIH